MRKLTVAAAAALLTLSTHGVAHADTVRLTLNSVRVDQQRETSGDRPYFATLVIRARLCQRNSTTVTLMEREPHDWVSKPEFNAALRGADHMRNGQSLAIPSWMGQVSFDNVNVVPLMRGDRINPEAVGADIMGVAVFSFDNNNTPPHVIRGLMNRAADLTRTIMREQVERCSGLVGDFLAGRGTADVQNRVTTRLRELALQTVNVWDVADLLLQLTVGSTFNPDQPTGVQFVLMPAISGLSESRGDPVPQTGLPGGPVNVQTWMLTPSTRSDTLVFEGSGARYTTPISFQLTPAAAAAVATASSLQLRLRTGGDDLRGGNDNVFAAVQIAGIWRPEVQLNRAGARWPDNTTNDAVVPLPAGTRVSDIQAVRLRTTFGGGMGGDNWNMDSLRVEWRGPGGAGGLIAEHGFMRFTGDQRELTVPARR